ncbi:CMPK, partial [Symbiodinium natans]
AVQLLEQAFSKVEADDQLDEVALARVGVQVLLCAGLSQAARHAEALDVAQCASEAADFVVSELYEKARRPSSDSDKGGCVSRALLQRAVEISVQARQCQALELEFMGPRDIDMMEFWDSLRRLHQQSLSLAEALPHHSVVRLRAAQAKREWQIRAAEATLPKAPLASSSLGQNSSLQVWRSLLGPPPKCAVRRSDAGAGLPKHQRMHLGIPPPVDMDFERRRRANAAERRPGSMETLSSTSLSSFASVNKGLDESSSAPQLGGWSPSDTGSSLGVKPWSRHPLPAGDLYVCTSPRRTQLPRTPNWASTRRVPVLFSVQGTKGKASWALRSSKKKNRDVNDDKRMNAFEDWRKNGSGPKMRLIDQVLQTENGIQHFQENLKTQSYRFKNFWLKDMVTEDDLYSDRTFFCSEGLRVLKRNPQRQPRAMSPIKPKAKQLFQHYDVQCPSISDLSGLHSEVKGYSELLEKSQETATSLGSLPYFKRGGRRMSFGQFDALKEILTKHRRMGVAGISSNSPGNFR